MSALCPQDNSTEEPAPIVAPLPTPPHPISVPRGYQFKINCKTREEHEELPVPSDLYLHSTACQKFRFVLTEEPPHPALWSERSHRTKGLEKYLTAADIQSLSREPETNAKYQVQITTTSWRL